MRISYHLVIAFAFTVAAMMSSCGKEETIIAGDKLPIEAKTYISTYFSELEITQAVKDKEGIGNSYDVYLSNGTVLEFDNKGKIESMKSTAGLPGSVIPDKLLAYVNTHYPAELITEWDIDRDDQEIQLSNGLELIFTKSGDFIRLDS